LGKGRTLQILGRRRVKGKNFASPVRASPAQQGSSKQSSVAGNNLVVTFLSIIALGMFPGLRHATDPDRVSRVERAFSGGLDTR
jgi:hypothetical protein